MEETNIVNTPDHYTSRSMECIDIIKVMVENLDPFEAYCIGNVIKYIYRYHDKNGVEDLMKTIKYINFLKDYII